VNKEKVAKHLAFLQGVSIVERLAKQASFNHMKALNYFVKWKRLAAASTMRRKVKLDSKTLLYLRQLGKINHRLMVKSAFDLW
jgi:hypothetical protein